MNVISTEFPFAVILLGLLLGSVRDDGTFLYVAISSVFTKFYVDHTEPLKVLAHYKNKGQWCLGELTDGHEFLTIFPITPVSPISPIRLCNSK
jgi:hypothetical protein